MTLRVAVAQIRPKKADYAENVRRVGNVLADVSERDEIPDLVVFPESVMTGYFLEGGVRESAVTTGTLIADLDSSYALSGRRSIDVVVGYYEEFQNRIYNSALYATLSESGTEIRHVHRKVFLPTYGMFDEQRFVNSGRSVQAFDTGWGRAAILICEDSWHSITGTLAALDGAQVVIVPSAASARGIAPEAGADEARLHRPNSVKRWEGLMQHIAAEHGVYVIMAQLVGIEGGKALQGASTVVAPDGDVVTVAPVFDDALIVADLELDAITRVRATSPLLADLESQLLNLIRSFDETDEPVEFDASTKQSSKPVLHQSPINDSTSVVAEIPKVDPLAVDCELTERWLTTFLREEVVERRGFAKGIVGLSGGVDSALTASLAARALGPENVIGVRMPYKTSSADSLDHAQVLANQLGICLETVDITAAVDAYLAAADHTADATRRGNLMARMRMITLFDLSAKYEALPLGTGNKTERLFGYFTWHGDDAPPINPLGDLFKTQVWELARFVGVPGEILSKPPSADLVQGQTDEGDLGISYASADRILHSLLTGLRAEQIVALGHDRHEVELVSARLNGTHWKRRLPTVAMLSDTAIGESYLRPVDY
jgi:NAD+ synthase (glutamine-hydrolysing)